MPGTGPIRLGLIGCGTVATREHLPGFRAAGPEAVEVVAFTSRTHGSAERAQFLWGSGTVVDCWQDVLAREDVDAVDIATPPDLHREIAVAAARAGKHVLVEKPMALTFTEAREMGEAARSHHVVLETAEWPRYHGAMRAAGRALRSGRIGELTGIEGYLAHGGPQHWAPDAAWFFDQSRSGGGALMDLGVHAIDGVRAVTGEDATEVAALLYGVVEKVEREADVLFRLASGVPGHLRVSWRAPYENAVNLVAWGTTGQLTVTTAGTRIRCAGGAAVTIPSEPSHNLYADFLAACGGKTDRPPAGEDGQAAMAFVSACYRSAGKHAWVQV